MDGTPFVNVVEIRKSNPSYFYLFYERKGVSKWQVKYVLNVKKV